MLSWDLCGTKSFGYCCHSPPPRYWLGADREQVSEAAPGCPPRFRNLWLLTGGEHLKRSPLAERFAGAGSVPCWMSPHVFTGWWKLSQRFVIRKRYPSIDRKSSKREEKWERKIPSGKIHMIFFLSCFFPSMFFFNQYHHRWLHTSEADFLIT